MPARRRILADVPALDRMRQAARAEYLRSFTAAANYERLMAIYAQASAHCRLTA